MTQAAYLPGVSRMEAWGYGILPSVAVLGIVYQKLGSDLGLEPDVNAAALLFALMAGVLLCSVPHELLHGLFFGLASKGGWASVSYGFRLKPLQLLTRCTSELSAVGLRLGLLAPALVLGLLPTMAGLWADDILVCGIGVSNLAACGNDFALVTHTMKLPRGARILMDDNGCRSSCVT